MMMSSFLSRSTIIFLLALFIFVTATQAVYAQAKNVSDPVGARVVETGVMQNVVGFTDKVLGAEVISITPEENGTQVIDVVIPINPEEVDQIRVVTPDGRPLKQKRAMEISMDHENNEVIIILKLSKQDSLGFKFKLIDLPDDQ